MRMLGIAVDAKGYVRDGTGLIIDMELAFPRRLIHCIPSILTWPGDPALDASQPRRRLIPRAQRTHRRQTQDRRGCIAVSAVRGSCRAGRTETSGGPH